MDDPNGTPPEGKWKEAGFDSEDAMLEAAKAATDLRSQITEAEATLKKERDAKSKTDSDYLRQSNEIGDLRKKLKDLEKPPEAKPDDANPESTDDEVLESVSTEEGAAFDAVLNDPANTELKKRVALGKNPAMAEFVKSMRKEVPVDLSVPLFGSLKKKKSEMIPASSIAKAVKELFAQHSNDERNSLAAALPGGALPDKGEAKKQPRLSGGVPADFFRAKKEE